MGKDLKSTEREIVRRALDGVPATLLKSPTRDSMPTNMTTMAMILPASVCVNVSP